MKKKPNRDNAQHCRFICKETRWGSPFDRRPSSAEAPAIGKIHPFSKITITFEPVMRFGCPSRFRISKKIF
jgi:hypothetical protein